MFDGERKLRYNGRLLLYMRGEDELDNLEAIANTDGIDALFLGPSDLSIALSQGGVLDPLSKEPASPPQSFPAPKSTSRCCNSRSAWLEPMPKVDMRDRSDRDPGSPAEA